MCLPFAFFILCIIENEGCQPLDLFSVPNEDEVVESDDEPREGNIIHVH